MTASETTPPSISGAEARRAARNAGAIAAASLLSRGLQFGWQLILVPGLGPAAYGIYGAVAAFVMVGAALPNFGMGPIVVRDVAQRPALAGKYLTATLFMQTLLALLAYVGVNAAAGLGGYGEAVRVFVALAGINLIVDIVGNMANDILLAQERMLATSAVAVAHVVALVALAALGLATGYGLFGVYIGTIIAGLLRVAALWWTLIRTGTRPVFPFDRSVAMPLLKNGAPLALSAFIVLAYQQVDKLLTNRLIGDAETGYLALAFLVIYGVSELLNTTVLTAVYPLMSRAHGGGDLFGFMTAKLTFFTLLVALPVVLTISIFAPVVIGLFGAAYAPTAGVLQVLIWYALALMVVGVLWQAMLVQNRGRFLLGVRALSLVLNISLLLLLLPPLGVRGAAFASLTAECIALIIALTRFDAPGWNVRHLLPRVGRLAALALMTALVMVLLGGMHPLLGMVGGLVFYTAGIPLSGALAADDWDLLYRLAAAMPGGGIIRRWWKRDTQVNF